MKDVIKKVQEEFKKYKDDIRFCFNFVIWYQFDE